MTLTNIENGYEVTFDSFEGQLNHQIALDPESEIIVRGELGTTPAGSELIATFTDLVLENGHTYYVRWWTTLNGIETPKSNWVPFTPISPPEKLLLEQGVEQALLLENGTFLFLET